APGAEGTRGKRENPGKKAGEPTTWGTITEYAVPTAGGAPKGMAAGPLGYMWYVESAKDKVAKINLSGDTISSTEYSTGITASSQPTDIAAGPDGNLWFT